MSHNTNTSYFLCRNIFVWNFWTADLSCDEAFWETWVFRRSYNLCLPQNPLKQLFQYLKLVAIGCFSNMTFFAFDRNHHFFILFPTFLCPRNFRKSSSSKREYWDFLPHTFLLLLFCFLIFSSPASQFFICFLSSLNLFVVAMFFCCCCNTILLHWDSAHE